jgi:hypothetical protein
MSVGDAEGAAPDPTYDKGAAEAEARKETEGEAVTGLARYDPGIGPMEMGDLWVMNKRGIRQRCAVLSHPLGWELRITNGANLVRSQVVKEQPAVFDLADDWKHEYTKCGWVVG